MVKMSIRIGLQQQKTTPDATYVSYKRKLRPTINMGSPKLDKRRSENFAWSDESISALSSPIEHEMRGVMRFRLQEIKIYK